MPIHIPQDILLDLINEIEVEEIHKVLSKKNQYKFLPKVVIDMVLNIEKEDLISNEKNKKYQDTRALQCLALGLAMYVFYYESDNLGAIFYVILMNSIIIPTCFALEMIGDPKVNSQLRKIVKNSSIAKKNIGILVSILEEQAMSSDASMYEVSKKYIKETVFDGSFYNIFYSKNASSIYTQSYINSVAISMNTASNKTVNVLVRNIEKAIGDGLYEKQRCDQAIALLNDIKVIKDNKDKIAKCLEFKLGKQWVKFKDIVGDHIMFDELILDPVFTAIGHTYEREYIEKHLSNNNDNQQRAVDPNTNTLLCNKSLKSNIAVADLLAYLVLGEHDVKISNYPGFLDPKTGKRFEHPVLTPAGQTVDYIPGANFPRNVQLKQLMDAFPENKRHLRRNTL